MYPSGKWIGFWEQAALGRQRMDEFELAFGPDGTVHGKGRDVVGRFTIDGEWNDRDGSVAMTKQYIGKHRVYYAGKPDGEGSLLGTWSICESYCRDSGPFGLSPSLPRPSDGEPIHEIRT